MQLAKRDLPPTILFHLAAALGLGLLLGFMGPFGSYPAMERPVRYGFWAGLGLLGYIGAWMTMRALHSTSRIDRFSFIARAISIAVASALPMTFAASWALVYVQPGREIGPAQLPMLFAAVAAVQLVIAALLLGVEAWLRPAVDRDTAEVLASTPRFLGRMPVQLGRELVAVQAEDHYLRVHTRNGSTLILYRMSDALAELGSHDGLRVHRGWWVAGGAVAGTQRDGAKLSLLMQNGLRVPVSRAHVASVNARQWPRLPASSPA